MEDVASTLKVLQYNGSINDHKIGIRLYTILWIEVVIIDNGLNMLIRSFLVLSSSRLDLQITSTKTRVRITTTMANVQISVLLFSMWVN